jgi:hypothetical protein
MAERRGGVKSEIDNKNRHWDDKVRPNIEYLHHYSI